MLAKSLRVIACAVPLMSAQGLLAQFSAAPVVFAPTGDNSAQTQTVKITLAAPTAIGSISSPIPFNGNVDFIVLNQSGCAVDGTTVNQAGTVCSVVVRFRAAGAGVRTGTLQITDGAGNGTAIGLSGVGYYPQITITPAATRVLAGLGPDSPGSSGDGGASLLAALHSPEGIATDSFGNTYVADTGNNVVRMLDAFGNITTVAGGGTTTGASGDGQLATAVALSSPTWLAVDAAGNLYIAESGSHVIRRVAMSTSRRITTVAGNYTQGFTDNVTSTSAQLNNPQGIAVDPAGNLYIADTGNNRIRKVDSISGMITTVAGSGGSGFDAGTVIAGNAHFNEPFAIALHMNGDLYISDSGNHAVRKLSGGQVSLVAGTGTSGNTGDGALATAATLNAPVGLAIAPSGDLFIVDTGADVVRKVQASDGVIETVVGDSKDAGGYRDGVRASTDVLFNIPIGIVFDRNQNLFIVDAGNNVIREISASPGELNFAAQAAGTTSPTLPLRISNIGNAPLSLGSVAAADSITSSNFTVSSSGTEPCGATVGAGTHCSCNVVFSPQNNGFVAGLLNVTHVANNPNFNVNEPVYLTGGILTPLTIGPAAIDPVVQGTPLTATITAAGGIGTITVDSEGVLPSGVNATVSGATVTLAGTPTVAGSFPFTVFASDALGDSVAKTYTLQVLPSVISTTVTESIHVVDTPSELPGLSLTVNEGVHVSDVPSELASLSLIVNEAVHVNDTQVPLLTLSVNEVVHVTDMNVPLPGLSYSQVETIHVSDASAETPSLTFSWAEVVHVSDPLMDIPGLHYDYSEVVHVSDSAPVFSNGKTDQSITAPQLGGYTYGDAAVSLSATASSGLPVSVSVSGPAHFGNGKLTFTGAGNVTVTFTQSGDSTYNAAPDVVRSFTVAPAPLTVTATSYTRAFGTANPVLQYTITGFIGNDTGSFTGAPSLTTAAVTNSPAGSYAITPSNGTFTSTSYVLQNFVPGVLTITGHVAQTITFLAIPNVPVAAGPLTLTARSSSGLAITYTVTGPATVSKSRLTLTGPGPVSVTASQGGNSTYDPAASITRTFTVNP